MSTCRYEECQVPLDEINSSNVYPGYCLACAEEVVAFRPNADMPEEWFFVTRDEDLPEAIDVPSSDQCGMCGNSFFQAKGTPAGIIVTCVGGNYADDFIEGCGISRTTRLMPTYLVIF